MMYLHLTKILGKPTNVSIPFLPTHIDPNSVAGRVFRAFHYFLIFFFISLVLFFILLFLFLFSVFIPQFLYFCLKFSLSNALLPFPFFLYRVLFLRQRLLSSFSGKHKAPQPGHRDKGRGDGRSTFDKAFYSEENVSKLHEFLENDEKCFLLVRLGEGTGSRRRRTRTEHGRYPRQGNHCSAPGLSVDCEPGLCEGSGGRGRAWKAIF